MAATWKLEFPYRRSVGPVIGALLAGLRDRRILGVRTPGGKVLVPPLEYDPDTGEATGETVEVEQIGVVTHSAWVAEPLRNHPLDRPFCGRWCSSTVPTPRLHALDAGSRDAAAPGTRVRCAGADETEGKITDIACFEVQP